MKTKEDEIKYLDLKILQLEELQDLCCTLNKEEKNKNAKQDDTELFDLLKKNYTTNEEMISEITSIVEGKKKAKTVDLKTLEEKFDSYCVVCGIKKNIRGSDKFMGYDKFSSKCSNKKNILKNELKKLKGESTNDSKNESASESTTPSETTPV